MNVNKTWFRCTLTVTFMLFTTFLFGQTKTIVKGSVVSKETGESVPFVHVLLKDNTRGTVTNDEGEFYISIKPTDTLIFSSVGYERQEFVLPVAAQAEHTIVISLEPKTYQLDPVKVQAYRSIESFKQDILALDIPTDDKGFKLEIPKGYTLPPEGARDLNQNQGGVVIKGAVSGLYDAFSKEAKERKKLAAYRRDQENQKTITERYNVEVVKRVTNLSDEEVKQFMEWCKFEDEYILSSSDYELSVAMLKCLDEFKMIDK